jgi:hypothetical protein
MSRRAFDEALATRRLRKRAGVPPPAVPAMFAPTEQRFQADLAAAHDADDLLDALDAAIAKAAAAIIKRAFAELAAAEAKTMKAKQERDDPQASLEAWVAKGGTAWERIQALADARVAKADGRKPTRAQAIDDVLQTPEGRELYRQYLAEQDAVVKKLRRGSPGAAGDGSIFPSHVGREPWPAPARGGPACGLPSRMVVS